MFKIVIMVFTLTMTSTSFAQERFSASAAFQDLVKKARAESSQAIIKSHERKDVGYQPTTLVLDGTTALAEAPKAKTHSKLQNEKKDTKIDEQTLQVLELLGK